MAVTPLRVARATVATFLLLLLAPRVHGEKEARESCVMDADAGPCRAFLPRFYYNRYTQLCERFLYGGCFGNSNNFESAAECSAKCSWVPAAPKPCRLEMEVGVCRALIPRYFFNMTSGFCEEFIYGGCQGNVNNFKDAASCSHQCIRRAAIPRICLKRADRGECGAVIPRFHYNPTTSSCEMFAYSGCGGNDNNFGSERSCIGVCGQAVSELSRKDQQQPSPSLRVLLARRRHGKTFKHTIIRQ